MCAFPPCVLEASNFASPRCVTTLLPPQPLHATGEGESCAEPCCPAAGSWSRRQSAPVADDGVVEIGPRRRSGSRSKIGLTTSPRDRKSTRLNSSHLVISY